MAGAAETTKPAETKSAEPAAGPFSVPALAYAFGALEPHIDAKTMEIHHDKHHAAYVKNLNDAVAGKPDLAGKTVEELVKGLASIGDEKTRTAIRNNGGGHLNHTWFWESMTPGGVEMSDDLSDALNSAFGSVEDFKKQFNDAGLKRFGSGWVWLVKGKDGKLGIVSTANQDNPLTDGATPLLGNDVWEHAYYLKYQNKRADYLAAWWNVVNWSKVAERFKAAK
ncbi:MAG: superoxide dismutase [Candidatus Sumerlaeaceae bacterium]|nr:superoxide dismutase [Candidatus Sumerlaeaceae bacterium]